MNTENIVAKKDNPQIMKITKVANFQFPCPCCGFVIVGRVTMDDDTPSVELKHTAWEA